jgi:hypothetical protein
MKNSKRKVVNQQVLKKLLDKAVNNYSSENIEALAEGERSADEILSGEDRKRLGALIDPDYPKFAEIYEPVRDAECMMRWAEHEMYFKAGWAFGQRHKHAKLRCARNRPGE